MTDQYSVMLKEGKGDAKGHIRTDESMIIDGLPVYDPENVQQEFMRHMNQTLKLSNEEFCAAVENGMFSDVTGNYYSFFFFSPTIKPFSNEGWQDRGRNPLPFPFTFHFPFKLPWKKTALFSW